MFGERPVDLPIETLLVAKELYNSGYDLYHILEDGRHESHLETMAKLVVEEKIR